MAKDGSVQEVCFAYSLAGAKRGPLFHSHALRQVPRLVYVAASADGYVVGE